MITLRKDKKDDHGCDIQPALVACQFNLNSTENQL